MPESHIKQKKIQLNLWKIKDFFIAITMQNLKPNET